MPIISAKAVHKAFGAHVVLKAVDVTIRSGERVGVVGKNGAGKSTLGRILAGVEAADAGELQLRRGASILYLDQAPTFPEEWTAEGTVSQGLAAWAEALERHAQATQAIEAADADAQDWLRRQAEAAEDVERLGGFDQQHRIGAILGHLGIADPQQTLATMSGGERRRVALAKILVARPQLAVLDEPTNHLDAETIEWLERHLIDEYPGAVLLITHDRYLLDRVAQRTWEVSDGAVHSYDGGYEEYLARRAERDAHAERTERNRQNFLRQELVWLRRQPKARTTKQRARTERAERALAVESPKQEQSLELSVSVARVGKTILEAEGLAIGLDGREFARGLDLHLVQGERLGIVGKNGCGKTTLLRTLLGQLAPVAGRVALGKTTRVAYLDQFKSVLEEDKTVFEVVVGSEGRIELGGQAIEPRSYLERFGFRGIEQRKPLAALSGGERARVALACLLRQRANLVVLDEPTNDLDVATLSALEGMLVEANLTALLVTHDRYFLDRVATGLIVFEADGRMVRHAGTYAAYRERAAAQARAEPKQRSPAAEPLRPKRSQGLSWSERKELEALPERIDLLERRVSELTAALGDPKTYTDTQRDVAELGRDLERTKAEAEVLTARWEELESRAD
ncbi:MAG: ABC-F family ATP-binding cassette domain-containing protein [Polyangiaceae bacterium]